MRFGMAAPILLFAAGILCIVAAVVSGEAEVSLFLIFPIFSGTSGLYLVGIVLIIFSFLVGFAMLAMGQIQLARASLGGKPLREQYVDVEPRNKYGGVILVGPVPIAFGSDKKIALAMLVAGIILAIVILALLVIFLQ